MFMQYTMSAFLKEIILFRKINKNIITLYFNNFQKAKFGIIILYIKEHTYLGEKVGIAEET